ncbi:DUF362 domain-containing protein [Clostridium saudiense]|uniref:DUF362 domain-containing protein n=1 Tax=Clostridium saudiense TaxID=1414720 RepID=UPI0018AAB9A9|nr:DUF362 domain-containing protein [Clostridium saudiense]
MRVRRTLSPLVAITQNNNESFAIEEGLNLLNISSMINSNDVVVITPNWVGAGGPEIGDVVGPNSLKKIIQIIKSCNPKRIVIATASARKDVEKLMIDIGFMDVIKSENVEFINLNNGPFINLPLNHSCPKSIALNKLYDEMTFLISFTQLKIHEEATISASIKNIAMGWPTGEEQGYPKKNLGIHKDLHGFISAMLEKFTIDLSIVSASPAMVGTGPHKGIGNHTGLVLCGTDPIATDTVGARLLGFKPQAINYLYKSINKGLGCGEVTTDSSSPIKILGMRLIDAEKHFNKCAYGKDFSID